MSAPPCTLCRQIIREHNNHWFGNYDKDIAGLIVHILHDGTEGVKDCPTCVQRRIHLLAHWSAEHAERLTLMMLRMKGTE
jgi:hypothetical protein